MEEDFDVNNDDFDEDSDDGFDLGTTKQLYIYNCWSFSNKSFNICPQPLIK